MNKFLILVLFVLISINPVFAIQDKFLEATLDPDTIEKPSVVSEYNYDDTTIIPIYLQVLKKILSENDVYEGQTVRFRVVSDVVYENIVKVKAGSVVTARIETIITSGMNGIPASIIIGNFNIPNISQSQIDDSYEVIGQDRSLIVFPLKWALTILPPTGTLTNFIKGGHAKLGTNKTIKLNYHPNWI